MNCLSLNRKSVSQFLKQVRKRKDINQTIRIITLCLGSETWAPSKVNEKTVEHPRNGYHIENSLIGKYDGPWDFPWDRPFGSDLGKGFLHAYLPGRHHTFKIKETTFYGHEMRTDPWDRPMGALIAPTNCGYDSPHDSTCLAHYLLVGLTVLNRFLTV